MKKRFISIALALVLAAGAYCTEFVLKGGADFAMTSLVTDAYGWSDPLKAKGKGFGFYIGMDIMFSDLLGIYIDLPFAFGKSFEYDGYTMSTGASYFSANMAFGLKLAFIHTNTFYMYFGAGESISIQNLLQPETSSDYLTDSKYLGLGINFIFGMTFFPSKMLGLDISLSDSLNFSTGLRNVRIDKDFYDLKDGTSLSNFFNVNVALAIRFGT